MEALLLVSGLIILTQMGLLTLIVRQFEDLKKELVKSGKIEFRNFYQDSLPTKKVKKKKNEEFEEMPF